MFHSEKYVYEVCKSLHFVFIYILHTNNYSFPTEVEVRAHCEFSFLLCSHAPAETSAARFDREDKRG